MATDPTIVLVPGAGLPPFIWDDVIPLLDADAVAVDYHHGASPVAANASLSEYAQKVASTEGPLVVVGHSAGAIVARQAAALVEPRLVGMVTVAGILPKTGDSFISSQPFPQGLFIRAITRLLGTRPPASVVRKSLCTDLNEVDTQRVVDGIRGESRRFFLDPVTGTVPDVPHLYIVADDDRAIPVATQMRYAERAGATTVHCPGGHLPMMSQAPTVARLINEFMAGLPPTRARSSADGRSNKS